MAVNGFCRSERRERGLQTQRNKVTDLRAGHDSEGERKLEQRDLK